MRFETLSHWLAWQEALHPTTVDMGLARVQTVAGHMNLAEAPATVITVGGTNGKGSTVAFLDALLRGAGHRVGVYTSPHLLRYNERVAVDGVQVDDWQLCTAFQAVDDARGDSSLTYFEFGTLAAMHHFREQRCNVIVLEVGMGGRLDASNAWDADASIVVSIGLDHTEWLGPDRESIGFEKAGIFRAGRPAVCADRDPPNSLLHHADTIGAQLIRVGGQYDYLVHADGRWTFQGTRRDLPDLPPPSLPGDVQYGNAAAAVAALEALMIDWHPASLSAVTLPGRFQRFSAHPEVILDVTHNAAGARVLAEHLRQSRIGGRTIAVCGMMADKPVTETLMALDAEVDQWIFASLPGPRGASAEALLTHAGAAKVRGTVEGADSVELAYERALALAGNDDRIVVFGSFVTVGAILSRSVGPLPHLK